MKIPTTLKHKPVFVVNRYEDIDGRNAYTSDAKGLSLGLAQWNDRGKVDVSAKVWRYTGEKWSRQSEELPLHRVIDLALLICSAKQYLKEEAYRYPKLYDDTHTAIAKLALQGDSMEVDICLENAMLEEDISLFSDAMAKDDELLSERLHRLADLLSEMGYGRNKKEHP
ncbi:MAG: DUF6530 family protein [Christensenellaceae bacterium]